MNWNSVCKISQRRIGFGEVTGAVENMCKSGLQNLFDERELGLVDELQIV